MSKGGKGRRGPRFWRSAAVCCDLLAHTHQTGAACKFPPLLCPIHQCGVEWTARRAEISLGYGGELRRPLQCPRHHFLERGARRVSGPPLRQRAPCLGLTGPSCLDKQGNVPDLK